MAPDTRLDPPVITAQWDADLADVKEFVRLIYVPRRMTVSFTVSFIVALMLTVGSWTYPAARTLSATLATATFAGLIWNLLVPILIPRRLWKAQSSDSRTTTWQVTQDGLTVDRETVTSTCTWDAVTSAVETEKVFLLYVSLGSFPTPLLMPKRAIDPRDIAVVRSLIAQHVARITHPEALRRLPHGQVTPPSPPARHPYSRADVPELQDLPPGNLTAVLGVLFSNAVSAGSLVSGPLAGGLMQRLGTTATLATAAFSLVAGVAFWIGRRPAPPAAGDRWYRRRVPFRVRDRP